MNDRFRVRILHLSDLHARVALDWMTDERKNLIRSQKAMRERVLGKTFEKTLAEIAQEAPVDLLCFTGDVADWGLAQEYEQASAVLGRVLAQLKLDASRVFAVPGNHDVNRGVGKVAWSALRQLLAEREDVAHQLGRWAARAGPPAGVDGALLAGVLSRQADFWAWLKDRQGRVELIPGATGANHPTLGYRATVRPDKLPFPIQIVGLNSGWLCGDENDKGKALVTREQVDWLCHDAVTDEPLQGFRLALMHHPLADLADWDATEVRQSLADGVDILLHGHQHDPQLESRIDPDRALTILAAGSIYEGDKGDRFFNSFHVIDVWLDEHGRNPRYDVTFYGWSKNAFWYKTDAVYSPSQQGKLSWPGVQPSEKQRTEKQDAAIPAEQVLRNVWHPSWDVGRRGPLTPCRFTINPNYPFDGKSRWDNYGDVLVSMEHPPTADDVYLVPSRKSPKRFHEPKKVGSDSNREPKKRVIEQFIKSVGTRPLDGFWFVKTMAKGGQRVHVYAKEFDDFLTAHAARPERTLVYISYKTSDDEWRLRLRELLDADGRIDVWDDSLLKSGSKASATTNYREVMKDAVSRTKVMVILASKEYLASPLPNELELMPAIAAAEARELSLLWVPIRAFDYKASPLEPFMAPVKPDAALADMTKAQWRTALYALYEAICRQLGLAPRPQSKPSLAELLKDSGLV